MADGVEIGTAYVSLLVSGEKVAPGVRSALGATGPEADRAGKQAGKSYSASFGSVLKGTLGAVGIAELGRAAIGFAKDSFAEAREAQKVGAQTEAVIKSTGGAAGLSAKQFGDLATSISNYAGIDDEVIQSAENALATFTNVRGNVFSKTTALATDMAVALGGDAKSAALQLGKALQDPAKGFSRLQRSGVTFSDSQVKQIKNFQKTGQLAKAQGVILAELSKEFGGSAAAQATAGDKARVAYKNLQEQIGTALLPVLNKTSQVIANDIVPAVSKFVSGMQDGTGAGGDFAAVLGDIYDFGKGVVSVIDGLPGPVKKFGAEALVAYAVLSKFGPGLSTATASTRTFVSGLANAETRLETVGKASYALGNALRQAAGIGGMLLLADSTKRTSENMRALEGAVGGALAGFSVGGPVGGAVGATAGAIGAMATYTDKSAEAFRRNQAAARDFASTLDDTTAAITRQTREKVLASLYDTSAIRAAGAIGLQNRDLVGAVLGQADAVDRVRAAMAKARKEGTLVTLANGGQIDAYNALAQAIFGTGSATDGLAEKFNADQAAKRKQINDLKSYKEALKGIPKQAFTQLKAEGFKPTVAQVNELIKKYNLSRKDVRTIISQTGVKGVIRDVNGAIVVLREAGKPRNAKLSVDDRDGRRKASAFKTYLNQLFGKGITQHVTVDKSAGGLIAPPGGGSKNRTSAGSRATTDFSASGAVFPSQVTLVDSSGQLLGVMDVVADNRYYANQAHG